MNIPVSVDVDRLVDPHLLLNQGKSPYTFLAFPVSQIDENGMPVDPEAKLYVARVQKAGVPVGVWLETPVKDTAYAFVGPDHIHLLHEVLETFVASGVYHRQFASDLTERLFSSPNTISGSDRDRRPN